MGPGLKPGKNKVKEECDEDNKQRAAQHEGIVAGFQAGENISS